MDDNDTQTKVEAAKAKAEAAKAEYEAVAAEAAAVAKYEAAKAKAEAAKEGNEYKEWLEYWDKRTGLNYNEEKHGTDYSGGWRKVQHQWQKLSDDCYVNDYGPTWFGKEPRYVEDYYVERKKFSRFLLGIRASFFEDKFFFRIFANERDDGFSFEPGRGAEIDCDFSFFFLLSRSSVDDIIRLIEYEVESKGNRPHLGVPVINYRVVPSHNKEGNYKPNFNNVVQFYQSDNGTLFFENGKELVSFKNYLERFLQSYETKKVWRGPDVNARFKAS